MTTEIEATFLETDHEQLRSKLKRLKARLLVPQTLMRRAIYDYPDLRLDKQAAWVRLRDEGERTTLTFKQRWSETIDGMREIEFEVEDFDTTAKFLQALGLVTKASQESKREIWQLDECEITLDTWPHIPPFTEIEGPSETNIQQLASKLGFDWNQALFDSIDAVYRRYFDVTRTEISSTELTFGPLPPALKAKRKK